MKTLLETVIAGHSLSRAQAESAIDHIVSPHTSAEQIAALLVSLRMKGESAEELSGFRDGLLRRALLIPARIDPLIDVCGTGGDRSGTFNVSTGVALVLASLGITVAKHGNRGVSSASGSHDVLEALHLKSDTTPEEAQDSLKKNGLTFLYAPAFHPTLAKVAAIRKNLGIYTVFNALGPLLNPAPLTHQMIGVYHPSLQNKLAEVLNAKKLTSALVLHGSDGLDEATLTGATQVVRVDQGKISNFTITPEDFGLSRCLPEALKGGNAAHNAEILMRIFSGEKSARRDLILINAALAFSLVKGLPRFKEACNTVSEALDSGLTLKFVERLKT